MYRQADQITSKLVDKNMKQWLHHEEILKKLKKEKAYMPVITISRNKGSHGTIIAYNLAKEMNFELFNKQFIETISENLHIKEEVVSIVDETVKTGIINWVEDLFKFHEISTKEYYYNLMQVIATIGTIGSTVMLGRGCNFIIKPNEALRVRIMCPLEIRSQRIAEKEEISVQKAKEDILESEKGKRSFIEKIFKDDINNPEAYDIIINTHFIDEKTAVELIRKAYMAKFNLD